MVVFTHLKRHVKRAPETETAMTRKQHTDIFLLFFLLLFKKKLLEIIARTFRFLSVSYWHGEK